MEWYWRYGMKIEEKGISTALIVGIVVTVVVVTVAGVAAAVVLLNPGEGTTSGGATTTTTTPWTTTTGGGIAGATSLTCTADVTSENMSGTITLKAKNIGTDELKIREEGTIQMNGTTYDVIYIVNGELQQAWACMDGQWMTFNFSEAWNTYVGSFQEELSGWTGGDYTYTDPTTGMTLRLYDIVLNPVLDDSLFIGQGGETTTLPGTTTTTTTPGGGVGSAASISFKEDITTEGTAITTTYSAKNIGSPQMKVRLEGTTAGEDFVYIVNGELQQAWMCFGGTWMDMSASFSDYWDLWAGSLEQGMGQLSGWTGEDYTYTDPTTGMTIRIYDVVLNPVLDDSLFIH
jgi:hypothetical protein